jgi:hypothetical protein
MIHLSILADEYKHVQKFLTDESVRALLCKRINTSLKKNLTLSVGKLFG